MHPTDKAARIAGWWYLSIVVTAPFCLMYVPGKVIVSGNATATATNILAHETLFRFGIVVALLSSVLFICLVMALYRLLSGVNKAHASLMVVFVLVLCAVGFLNELNNIAALILARGAPFLAVFDKSQLDALAYLFIRLHGQGNIINQIFWGFWLLPFGMLVMRSGFLPRIIGVLLIANCFAYLAIGLTTLLLPDYASIVSTIAFLPMAAGELSIVLWLLIKGAKVPPSRVAATS